MKYIVVYTEDLDGTDDHFIHRSSGSYPHSVDLVEIMRRLDEMYCTLVSITVTS